MPSPLRYEITRTRSGKNNMKTREATESDFEKIWPIFREIASAGETYAYPRNASKEEAKRFWMELPR